MPRPRLAAKLDAIAGWVKDHAPSPSTNHLIVMALVVSSLILSIAGATLLFTIQGRTAQDAQAQGAQVAACRSSLSARLVTGPTALALKSLALEGSDSDAFTRAAESADPGLFVELSILSDSDPETFLDQCEDILKTPPR